MTDPRIHLASLAVLGLVALCPGVGAAEPPSERARLDALTASEAEFSAGLAAQKRGDLEVAGDAYRSALVLDPGFVEAMANLARVHIARGDFAEAEEWLERATRQGGGYPGVAAARGLLALHTGAPARAIDELERARSLAPSDVEVLTNLGAALLHRGLFHEAIERLDSAQRLDPRRSATAFNLGLAYDLAEDTTRATYHYRRFLDLAGHATPDRALIEARLTELVPVSIPPESVTNTPTAPAVSATKGAVR